MRGSQSKVIGSYDGHGIIPAHAGLTQQLIPMDNAGRDHPRACGAHLGVTFISKNEQGSSPRMRGSPLLCHAYRVTRGIIPAHAGLTF